VSLYLDVDIAFIFLASISVIYYLVNSYFSIKYKQEKGNNHVDRERVTALIPVYNENRDRFASMVQAVKSQDIEFVVVGDACNEPYRTITESNGGRFLYLKDHGGKRKAVSEGIKLIDSDFVLLIDSDTVIPDNTVSSMLSKFDDDVGGIGANLSVKRDSSWISYSAEFVERSMEVLFRSLSSHGNVMLLDGACVMYRTSLVKPFIMSSEYTDHKVFGKKNPLGDDRQLTGYLIRSNYRAIKDYDVSVEVPAPETLKKFIKQNVRWMRSNWVNFFRELFNGTARKAGKFYTFDLLYTYLLPVLFVGTFAIQAYFALHILDVRYLASGHLHNFHWISIEAIFARFGHVSTVFLIRTLTTVANYMATMVFSLAIAFRISKDRLKTFAFGAIAMLVMLGTSIYGLITIWKQNGWMTR
jgi:cellulose synthase/poly-beta-1,6-N-acetylglucosamine synthase-like glycosyltransferase